MMPKQQQHVREGRREVEGHTHAAATGWYRRHRWTQGAGAAGAAGAREGGENGTAG